MDVGQMEETTREISRNTVKLNERFRSIAGYESLTINSTLASNGTLLSNHIITGLGNFE